VSVRVHLADDHTMFRQGLEGILASREGVEVVGASSAGEEAAALVERTKPDLVITQLDVDIKRLEGILKGIRRASPDSRIVVLTVFDNLRYLKALSGLGIDAYIHKSSSAEELLVTIEALMRDPDGGDTVISMPRGALERLEEGPTGGLSERELEVLVLAARGLSNLQISRDLHLAEATVKRHLANVYEKIGVGSRTEAVRMALSRQLIGIPEIIREAPSPDGYERDGYERDGYERDGYERDGSSGGEGTRMGG
jgi:DNA-binding NarL/FixJ family response regulator